MQTKSDFELLPLELRNGTVKILSHKDVVSVASTSTQHLRLFKPIIENRQLSQFLHHVVTDNYKAVEAMLDQDISLFYRKGFVMDCSQRVYENISGFEYALWALDKHMWDTILNCIPKNQKGNDILKLLVGQYEQVKRKGIQYTLNGEKITEHHFDLKNTLIKELRIQAELRDWKTIDIHWIEGVGGAQRLLPMHIVLVYCSDELFNSVPQFKLAPNSSKQFFNWDTNEFEDWFHENSKLGIDFAIYKSSCNDKAQVANSIKISWQNAENHYQVMTALFDTRIEDFMNLEIQLEARKRPTIFNKKLTSHGIRYESSEPNLKITDISFSWIGDIRVLQIFGDFNNQEKLKSFNLGILGDISVNHMHMTVSCNKVDPNTLNSILDELELIEPGFKTIRVELITLIQEKTVKLKTTERPIKHNSSEREAEDSYDFSQSDDEVSKPEFIERPVL